jgi:hypothetical protein
MSDEEIIINYIDKLLPFITDLRRIGDKRIAKENSPKKLFMLFSMQEASNSFLVFRDLFIRALKDPSFFTQLSVIARNIHEIFLTFFWVRKENIEELYFAYSLKEDFEFLELYDEITGHTGKHPFADAEIRNKIIVGKKYYSDLLSKTKTSNSFIKTEAKGADRLFPSWDHIAERVEYLYKEGFFASMKLGHKNYYRLVSLATHFRPSSVTANIPTISAPEATSTSKKVISQITIILMLLLTEEITNRLAYGVKYKKQLKTLTDDYNNTIAKLF